MLLNLLTLLVLAFDAHGQASEDAIALAGAIDQFYQAGCEASAADFERLASSRLRWDDASWWLARCRVEEGRHEEALDLLIHGRGERIPRWRFPLLSARAALGLGRHEEARGYARQALALFPGRASGGDDGRCILWLNAALAARAGDSEEAAASLERLGGGQAWRDVPPDLIEALPELDGLMLAPLADGLSLPGPLDFLSSGRRWRLYGEAGLAVVAVDVEGAHQEGEAVECGTDLCGAGGEPLLQRPAARFSPVTVDGVTWYGCLGEPLASGEPGIYRLLPGGALERVTIPPAGAIDDTPLPMGGALFFVRRAGAHSRLHVRAAGGEVTRLAPDLDMVSAVAAQGDMLVLAAVVDGRSRLRWLPALAGPEEESRPLLAADIEAWQPRWAPP